MPIITSDYSTSAAGVAALTACWIKDPADSSRNTIVNLRRLDPQVRSSNEQIFYPLNAGVAVVVATKRRTGRGTMVVQVTTESALTALDLMLGSGRTLLFQKPLEVVGGPVTAFYFRVGGETSLDRLIQPASRPHRDYTIPYVEVQVP